MSETLLMTPDGEFNLHRYPARRRELLRAWDAADEYLLKELSGQKSPNSKYRAKVTPARRGKRKKSYSADQADQTPAEKRASMTWAQRLKRV